MCNLHVYTQDGPHDSVFIVGDKAALCRLTKQLQMALEMDEHSGREYFAADGEGYSLFVLPVRSLENFIKPYTNLAYEDHRSDLIYPWVMVHDKEKR